MEILARKDAINHHKDAINRRLYQRLIIVETVIHRVYCLNRTVLGLGEVFVLGNSISRIQIHFFVNPRKRINTGFAQFPPIKSCNRV